MYQYTIARHIGKEDLQVYEKCDDIRKGVKKSKVKLDIHDYPSVAVGCFTNYNMLFIDTTNSKPNYSETPSLLTALLSLGFPIGSLRVQCRYPIGCCAEPKAAFRTIKTLNCGLKLLKFTTAYRPRTGEKMKYCRNCKDVFGL